MSADGSVVAATNVLGAVIWRVREQRPLVTRERQSNVRFIAVSPDGRWLATGSGEILIPAGARVWDAATGEIVARLPVGRMTPVWFSPDGKRLVTGGSRFRTWEVGSWREGPALGGSEQCNACAFTRDGRLAALGDAPGVVRLVDLPTGRELARLTAPVQTRLWPKCFTPDGRKLIVVGNDTETLHIFDLGLIGAQLHELHLDWDVTSGSGAGSSATPSPLHVQIVSGQGR